ncbi:hypothetical protein AB1Y20_019175 [Prymnesium parvum]|uniref:Glycosyl hydrolase family 13 catalytic domain-containing protein n=1 Tax=Prymnesium parvum TaxID=97485 RepID=A0AB34JTC7_PRYPA
MLGAAFLLVAAAAGESEQAQGVLQPADMPVRRAVVTLLYGEGYNNTNLVKLQARALSDVPHSDSVYEHVVMVTRDVPVAMAQSIAAMGSRVINVPVIPMPRSLQEQSKVLGGKSSIMGEVWGTVFTKLHIWNLTEYDQVVFLDSDAFPTSELPSASTIYDECGEAAFCAVRDSMLTTPYGAPLLNAGMMVVRPNKTFYHELLEVLDEWTFDPTTKTPEQTFLSDYHEPSVQGNHTHQMPQAIKWLNATYNFGCHDPAALGENTGIGLGSTQTAPRIWHMCGATKLVNLPLCPQVVQEFDAKAITEAASVDSDVGRALGGLGRRTNFSDLTWPCDFPAAVDFQKMMLEVNPCLRGYQSMDHCLLVGGFSMLDQGTPCDWCGSQLGCILRTPFDLKADENDHCRLHSKNTVGAISRLEGARGLKKKKAKTGDECASVGVNCDKSAFSLADKSIYMLMVDRFGRVAQRKSDRASIVDPPVTLKECREKEADCHVGWDGHVDTCLGDRWCGGTINGITDNLDYIADMGFDCVWVTPVMQTVDHCNEDWCLSAYHGYWPQNFEKVDSRFGTSQDLVLLSQAVKARGMCFILDVVANHVRPVRYEKVRQDLATIFPFNKPEHYHWQRSRAPLNAEDEMSLFEEYARHPMRSEPRAPCEVGDFECPGYNHTMVQNGWFLDDHFHFGLPDLKQENENVSAYFFKWVKDLVEQYALDAIRLDTAGYMPLDFVRQLRQSAGVEFLGEVTASNHSFLEKMLIPSADGAPAAVDAVTDFPGYYSYFEGFCGIRPPHAQKDTLINNGQESQSDLLPPDLTKVLGRMNDVLATKIDPSRLSSFLDSHDESRFSRRCGGDAQRVANALSLLLLAPGVPSVYYGTEQGFNQIDHRVSLWQTRYATDHPMYTLIRKLNYVRKATRGGVFRVVSASQDQLVAVRHLDLSGSMDSTNATGVSNSSDGTNSTEVAVLGNGTGNMTGNATGNETGASIETVAWLFVNNRPSTESGRVLYCTEELTPPLPKEGQHWVDLLSNEHAQFDEHTGCFSASNGNPKLLVSHSTNHSSSLVFDDLLSKVLGYIPREMVPKLNPDLLYPYF